MKATEDESKRSPTRRRLFGPVDHNQNKVDASLIWTNINPGFPRVDYSPRFRPRPVDRVRSTEGGRGVEMEGEVDMEGGVQMESSVVKDDCERGETDQTRSTGKSSEVRSAGILDASYLNNTRSWNENATWARSDRATTCNLSLSTASPASPTGCSVNTSAKKKRPLSEHHYTDDCTEETDPNTGSSCSPMSLDPSCRSRPATCPWRTLPGVDPAFRDEGRTRSASLGHINRPSCSRQRFSCRNSTDEGSRSSTNLEPTYKKVPVVQLCGPDATTVLCPPGQDYFFKPIGGGEESPALTASQSPDEGVDDESSGGTQGSTVDSRRLQETLTSEAENVATTEGVLRIREDVVGVEYCGVVPEVAAEEQRMVPQQQQQSTRRRKKSIDETDDLMEHEKDEEVAGHDFSDRDVGNGEEGNREEGNGERRADRKDLSGRRIKDKLVTTPPKAKKRKPYEDGNSDSPY